MTTTSIPREPLAAALEVLDRHMRALNARDQAGLAETLHFPHYRLAAGGMRVWQTSEHYFADFLARAGEGWHHSGWLSRKPISASAAKIHLDVTFARYRADGSILGEFRSLWIITRLDGRWAAQLRSSFAG